MQHALHQVGLGLGGGLARQMHLAGALGLSLNWENSAPTQQLGC